MRLARPIGFEERYQLMAGLGDLSLVMTRPFTWVTRHQGVLVKVEDQGDAVMTPVAFATNPYSVVDEHWRMLTQGSPILVLTTGGVRHAFWSGRAFTQIEV